MVETLGYKTIGPEQVRTVIQAYIQVRSCGRASMEEGVYCSAATVGRVINVAVEEGVMDPEIKRERGRPRIERGRIADLLSTFPAATVYQIAQLASVSEITVYRTKKGE